MMLPVLCKFSSSNGERFAEALCKFCRNQSHALEMLRVRQRKDQKFANFIQVLEQLAE